jgi:putative phage-type endonuclease
MVAQGSEEWRKMRCGKVTASRVSDVVAKTKSGPSASRKNYMAELLVERLTGVPNEGFRSKEMDWGKEHEPMARELYEFRRDVLIEQVDFIDHPLIPMAGASPDGLVGADGLTEFKCPNTATHLETILGGSIPKDYADQIQWQMACTGRKWCDFISYDPRMPEEMRLHIQRVYRDDAKIRELEAEIRGFLIELDAKVAGVRAAFRKDAA